MKYLLTKISYEGFYAVWKVVSFVADIIYSIVCAVSRSLDHQEFEEHVNSDEK